jgi:hypothetical protein
MATKCDQFWRALIDYGAWRELEDGDKQSRNGTSNLKKKKNYLDGNEKK